MCACTTRPANARPRGSRCRAAPGAVLSRLRRTGAGTRRHAVRHPRARRLRPARRLPLQRQQAAGRPLGARHRRRREVAIRPSWVTTRRTPRALRPSLIDSAPAMPRCRVIDGQFDWEDDQTTRGALARHLHLRAARQGLYAAASGCAARMARQIPRAHGAGRARSSEGAGRDRGRAHAGARVHQRGLPARTRPHQLLGLQHAGLVRAHQSLRGEGSGGRAQAGGQGAAQGGHRGDPRRGLQPHRRGQPAWARRSTSAASTTARTTFIAPTTGASTTTSPAVGNTVACDHPIVQADILSSLRYFAEEFRIDGFRFDLATVLGRDRSGFNSNSPFFSMLAADPVLAYVKLIAEPWDVGLGGYQLGNFPQGWSEWNDRYRDTMRAFWHGGRRMLGGFAERFAGSSDLFRRNGRKPTASINFVAAHDGFTLRDTVSYNEQAQRGQSREQPRRPLQQSQLELRRRRSHRRRAHHRAAPPPGSQHADDAVLLAGRAHVVGRRRAVSHAERQQQCLLPGQRNQLGRLGRSQGRRFAAAVRARAHRRAPCASRTAARHLSQGRAARQPFA